MNRILFKMLGLQVLAIATVVGLPNHSFAAEERAFVNIEKERGLPARGQTRASVKERFGEPTSIKPAVGSPPISSWQYGGFIVYFEHNLVITTVADEDQLPISMNQIQ